MKLNRVKRNVMAILATIVFLPVMTGCSATKAFFYSFKSLDQFAPLPADNRVRYEAGAENFAMQIAKVLPKAINHVEQSHYASFKEPITVYACASQKNFQSITGRNVRAIAYRGGIFVSPEIMDPPKLIYSYVTHELSHLLLYQSVGGYKYIKIPSWFLEGLAVLESDGGGADQVSDEKAIQSIISRKHFDPLEKSGVVDLFIPKYASYWGLDHHMFYRQCMLFVRYFRDRDPGKYKQFLVLITQGKNFSEAFHTIFGMNTMQMWNEFTAQISNGKG